MIDELSLSDQEKLVAIMEAGCDEVSDIDDLINLTFNLPLANYIDYERYGRDIAMDEQGHSPMRAMSVSQANAGTGSLTGSLMIFPTNTGLPAQGKPPSVTAPSPFSSLSRERSLM